MTSATPTLMLIAQAVSGGPVGSGQQSSGKGEGWTEFSTSLAAGRGDLEAVEKSLVAVQAFHGARKSTCGQVALDHEVSVKAFVEDVKALSEATPVLRSETSAAQEPTYSLMQVVYVGLRTRTDIQGFDVVTMVRRPAEKEHQLASHISAVMKFVAGKKNRDLIERLQKEASAETSHKAYYHKKMAKSTEKKEDLEGQVAKHSSKLESAVARSNTLAGEVAELPADLCAVAAQQLKMDTLRGEERKIFATAREDLKQGIAGIQKASGIFRENRGASFIQQPDAP